MSVTIRHLNADTTFLLTFQPNPDHSFPPSPGYGPDTSTFSILLDPWLFGVSQLWHPRFMRSRHKTAPCISSLSEIPEPDLVVISQNRPDHCHQATLQQLPADGTKTLVLADPAAARTIKSWKYFNPEKVHSMDKYDNRITKTDTVRRFPVPPSSPYGTPGEVTIAFIPEKRDVAGVHSAIGITYRPPSAPKPFHPTFMNGLPTPPDSPMSGLSSIAKPFNPTPPLDRTISVLYSPHGISYAQIRPYASSHLVSEAALPLTALLHSFDRVQNPWWMGGNISSGLPGGVELARNLLARVWISAHDEEKEVGGMATRPVRTRKYHPDEVRDLVSRDMGRMGTEVMVLGVGAGVSLRAS
ncbi:MAG: hypothetical protein M1817_002165 [Caeruleum heppii]|nr:MAG: hypothetical protein M1817_002165 [Caeruleum heppii]